MEFASQIPFFSSLRIARKIGWVHTVLGGSIWWLVYCSLNLSWGLKGITKSQWRLKLWSCCKVSADIVCTCMHSKQFSKPPIRWTRKDTLSRFDVANIVVGVIFIASNMVLYLCPNTQLHHGHIDLAARGSKRPSPPWKPKLQRLRSWRSAWRSCRTASVGTLGWWVRESRGFHTMKLWEYKCL